MACITKYSIFSSFFQLKYLILLLLLLIDSPDSSVLAVSAWLAAEAAGILDPTISYWSALFSSAVNVNSAVLFNHSRNK